MLINIFTYMTMKLTQVKAALIFNLRDIICLLSSQVKSEDASNFNTVILELEQKILI